MENKSLFVGDRIRLVAMDPERATTAAMDWSKDSEFWQLYDTDAPRLRPAAKISAYLKEHAVSESRYAFLIEALEDARLLGEIGLSDVTSTHRNGWMFIGIGKRDDWGKGYGTDAVKVILRYAFTELNLHRVNLGTFGFNTRAVRSYEKVGFVMEGRQPGALLRYGQRWDQIYMGILKREWEMQRTAE